MPTSAVTLVDNEYITLQYLPEKKMIYHVVHKPFDAIEVFETALEAGSAALQKYGVSKWLSDDRKNGPLTPAFYDWATNVWQPRTIDTGWRYWANVVPTEKIAAGTLSTPIEHLYNLGLRMMVFSNVEDAQKWLDKQES